MSTIGAQLANRWSAPPLTAIDQVPMSGKTILVTGGNTGLGFEAARHFIRLGASKLILGVRSKDKGDEAKRSLQSSFDLEKTKSCIIDVWVMDLASFASTKAFGYRVNTELDQLDIAVLNAAVSKSQFGLTADGWEETLQVNTLSTALLALLLLPKMQQSAQPDWTPRISVVTSRAHMIVNANSPWLDAPSILQELNQPGNYGKYSERYAVSKLLMIYVTRQIAKLATKPDGKPSVIVNHLCPGACKSDLARDWNEKLHTKILLMTIQSTICKTTEEGSRTLVYAAGLGEESHGCWIHKNQLQE